MQMTLHDLMDNGLLTPDEANELACYLTADPATFYQAPKALQDKAEKAASKVDVQQAQSSSAKMSTLVEIGGSLLGMFMGRKTSIVKASTVNSASRVWKEGADVKAAQSELDSLKADMAELEKQIADETQKIRDQYDPATLDFETFKLSPMKKNIQVTATGILWLAKA